VHFKKSQQVAIEVNKCGFLIDSNDSWFGASPDGIVFDPTQQEHQRGCLEVKYPYVCEKRTITDAYWQVSAFYLVEHEGSMCLSESHKYFYQVQTQMHVNVNSNHGDVVACTHKKSHFRSSEIGF